MLKYKPTVLDVTCRKFMSDDDFGNSLDFHSVEKNIAIATRQVIGEAAQISPELLHPGDKTCQISPLFRWYKGNLSFLFDVFRSDFDSLLFQDRFEKILEINYGLKIIEPTMGMHLPRFSCLSKGLLGWSINENVDADLILGEWVSGVVNIAMDQSRGGIAAV